MNHLAVVMKYNCNTGVIKCHGNFTEMGDSKSKTKTITLPETNIGSENGWLED